MKNPGMILGLAPWILFSAIAEHVGANAVSLAALLAGAGSLILALYGASRDGLKTIDVAGVVTFAAIALIGALGNHHVRQLLVDYGRGGCAAVLALVMLVSAYTVPFTEQYARQQIDRRYWGSPVFRATNRRISLIWAGLIAVMASSHLLSGVLAATGHERPIMNLGLNWAVPVFIVLHGMQISERVADGNMAVAA